MGVIIKFRGPEWFYGFDAIIQLFGSIIALVLAIYGYKAYKLSHQKKYLYFSMAFGLLAINLIIYALFIPAVFIVYNFYSGIDMGFALQVGQILNFIFMAATLGAYILLIASYAKLEQKSVILILLALSLVVSLFAFRFSSITGFNLTAVLLLLAVMAYNCKNCIQTKSRTAMLVFLSFFLIALGHLFFVGSGISTEAFLIGHIAQLIGYVSLLIMFIKVHNHAKKN